MGTIVGHRAEDAEALNREMLPKIRNRYRYLLKAHPLRWYFDEDDYDEGNDGWLPDLGRTNLTPGVGGVGDGNVIDLALVTAHKEGWQILHDNDPRLGPYKHYMQKFPSRGKAAVWGSIFETVTVQGGRAIWGHDDDARRGFLRYLVDHRIVQPIDEGVRDQLVSAKAGRLEAQIGRFAANSRNTVLSGRIQDNERLLGKMRGDIAPGEAPRPRVRRMPGRAAPAAAKSKPARGRKAAAADAEVASA
jgi:hypothetical protein